MPEQQFDVFLAHSSKDKPLIRQIYRKLQARGLKPWLDEEEIAPGTSFQDEIQQAIGQIKTAAICIGQGGLGPWQALELKTFISQCIHRSIPVIPVLLPGVANIPEQLLFLREFNAVTFITGIEDETAFYRLEWGITGKKPEISTKGITAKPISSSPKSVPVSKTVQSSAKPISVPRRGQNSDPKVPRTISQPPTFQSDDISSEKFGPKYYGKLRDLLKAKDWRSADDKTAARMCEVMNRQDHWLRREDLEKFPCQDLRNIDRLWLRYSNGHFGFSVQHKIWQSCGSPKENNQNWRKFLERLKWNTAQRTFDLTAPKGHLPRIIATRKATRFVFFTFLAARLTKCKI